MAARPRATRKPLNSGQRLLFRDEEAFHLVTKWIEEDKRVKAYNRGRNNWEQDKDEWFHYIYITRKANNYPLDSTDVDYLDALISKLAGPEVDLDEDGRDEGDITPSVHDINNDESHKASASSIAPITPTIQRIIEDSVLPRIENIDANLDKKFETMMRFVDGRIERLRRQEILAAVQGDQEVYDTWLKEETGKSSELEKKLEDSESYKIDLEKRIVELDKQLSEKDAKLSELSFDCKDQSSHPQDSDCHNDYIRLAQYLCDMKGSELFRNHLKERLSSNNVPINRLVEAIGRIWEGKAKGKSLSRDGHKTFFEYKCNLGYGSGTGRLYFDRNDGFWLLGFGDKDHQGDDIESIFQTRKN